MIDVLRAAIVLGLVAGNAFFVAAEYAIVTARRAPLTMRAEAGSRRAAAALRLMDEPVRVISTVQVGVSAISILAGAVGEPLVRAMLGDDVPPWLGFLIAFGIVTYLAVVLGELVPKAIALDRSEQLAAAVAPAIEGAGAALGRSSLSCTPPRASRCGPWASAMSASGRPSRAPRSCASSSTRPSASARSRARRRSCCTPCSRSPTSKRPT